MVHDEGEKNQKREVKYQNNHGDVVQRWGRQKELWNRFGRGSMLMMVIGKVSLKESNITRQKNSFGIWIIDFVSLLMRGIPYENTESGPRRKFRSPLFESEDIGKATKSS